MRGAAPAAGGAGPEEDSVLFVVSGPSGCGKSTLIRKLLETVGGLRFSVSHTTRLRREGERDGREYHFIERPVFEDMARSGAFLEWAVVHGHLYGTSRAELEIPGTADPVLDIDVQGARQVKVLGLPAVFIFVVPPRFEDLRERLEKRGLDDPETIRRRLKAAVGEVEAIPDFDYLIINGELGRAAEDLAAVVRADRCRVGPRPEKVRAVLEAFRSARLD